ncbi:MAG: PAS domain S-box protein [Syntrophothermus sp.]
MIDDSNQGAFGQNTVPIFSSNLENFTILLENIPEAVISFDKEKKIIFWNKGAEKIYGWTHDEVIGRNLADLLSSEASEEIRNKRLSEVDKKGEIKVETVHYTKENKRIIVQSHVITLRNIKGDIAGYTSVNSDITQTRKTEEDLKDSEARYSALFNNKTNAIAHCRTITDHEGKPVDYEIIRINDAYTAITGIKKEEIEGRRAREVFPGIENFSFDYITEYGKVALFGRELKNEVYFEALSQWFSIYAYSPMPGEFTAIFTDITQRKNAEEDLKKSEENLNEAQKLAHMCSFTFDFENNRIEWSNEFLNIYELDDLSGYPTLEKLMELVYPEDRRYVAESVRHAIENKIESLQMDYRILTGRGNLKYVHYNGKLSYNEKGKHTKRFGTIMDVTDRKLKELELRKILENLERSNKDLEQFAYVASHDLQEPLRMISVYSTMLDRQLKDNLDDKTKQNLEILIESSKRMHILITGLLEYSRISSDKEVFCCVDMNEIANRVIKDLSYSISESKAEIKIENLPGVNANPAQMKQLLQNLISNAIKFRWDADPIVEVKAEKKENEFVFSVRDNGIGISPENYERIFVIFKRLHTREEYPGTGIGLSICKRIVEHHGGRLWIESNLGKGAAFYFTLPV